MKKLLLMIMLCVFHPVYAAHVRVKPVSKDNLAQNVIGARLFATPPEPLSQEKMMSRYSSGWVYSWQSADEHWRKEMMSLNWDNATAGVG